MIKSKYKLYVILVTVISSLSLVPAAYSAPPGGGGGHGGGGHGGGFHGAGGGHSGGPGGFHGAGGFRGAGGSHGGFSGGRGPHTGGFSGGPGGFHGSGIGRGGSHSFGMPGRGPGGFSHRGFSSSPGLSGPGIFSSPGPRYGTPIRPHGSFTPGTSSGQFRSPSSTFGRGPNAFRGMPGTMPGQGGRSFRGGAPGMRSTTPMPSAGLGAPSGGQFRRGGMQPGFGTAPGTAPGAPSGRGQGRGTFGQTPGTMPGHGGRGQGYGGHQGGHPGGEGSGHHGHGGHEYHHPENINGFFFYGFPGFFGPYNYGYWDYGYGRACPDCYYSPFYSYGFPYVYGPRVSVYTVPSYTYVPVPYSSYGSDYYLAPGYYTGLNAVIENIRSAWINGNPDLLAQYVDNNTQIDIYADGKYSYSLPGTDYRSMVYDAIGRIHTISFTVYDLERRSDGAYVVYGKHEFNDVQNKHKVVYITYTLAQSGGRWVIVAAGSSETGPA